VGPNPGAKYTLHIYIYFYFVKHFSKQLNISPYLEAFFSVLNKLVTILKMFVLKFTSISTFQGYGSWSQYPAAGHASGTVSGQRKTVLSVEGLREMVVVVQWYLQVQFSHFKA
jgi:hypothetical protein